MSLFSTLKADLEAHFEAAKATVVTDVAGAFAPVKEAIHKVLDVVSELEDRVKALETEVLGIVHDAISGDEPAPAAPVVIEPVAQVAGPAPAPAAEPVPEPAAPEAAPVEPATPTVLVDGDASTIPDAFNA